MLVKWIGGLLAFSLLAGSTHLAHYRLIHFKPAVVRKGKPRIVLPPLEVLRSICFGFDNLVADVLWLQAIQHFGSYHLAEESADLYPLFRAITWLDPRFLYAYIFGSYALADEGLAASHAVALLRYGLRQNPTSWLLMSQLAFIYYFYAKQYRLAAHYYNLAADYGAPLAFRRLAAILYAKGGSRQLSRSLWTGILKDCKGDKYCSERAEHHLIELALDGQLDALITAIRRFHQDRGHYPSTLQELRRKGYISGWFLDPLKRAYLYDPIRGGIAAQPLPWDPKWKKILRERLP